MSCCPPDSLPYLQSDGTSKGAKNKVEDVEFFECNAGAEKKLLLIPDVWGWDSGRIRLLADHFAEAEGFHVVIPKLLASPPFEGGTDGDALPPSFDMANRQPDFLAWVKEQPFTMQEPLVKSMMNYLRKDNADAKIYLIGCCWGAYIVAEMCGSDELSANVVKGVGIHPSVGIAGIYGKNDEEIVKAMKAPVLWAPTKSDPDDYRSSGKLLTASPEGSDFVDFPTVTHGFFTRGDSKDEEVAKNVEKAIADILAFFEK